MKIAITGNIGSGKTEVIKFLLGLKYKCISSDKIIADLYKDSSTRKIILRKLKIYLSLPLRQKEDYCS
jgi:dephospho-CoA kinase